MHTIEAAICAGMTLLLVGILMASGPSGYSDARDASAAGARASYLRLDRDHLYETDMIRIGDCSLSGVSTSPDILRDLLGITAEALDDIVGWLDAILPRDTSTVHGT
jgi:hypothetical protein